MSNVIDFPHLGRGIEAASMLAGFSDRACTGEFSGAIVVTIADDGPSFQLTIGDASTSALLGAIGALDLIKARLARVVEAEQAEER